ncbi:hypothetical protein AB1Y20_000300 [Prymnesium parvum]|uniref:Secreted protein n=1 Tax=Prymnesium parvum TaxID=97485 RepID=A0AB34K839_PRYPA
MEWVRVLLVRRSAGHRLPPAVALAGAAQCEAPTRLTADTVPSEAARPCGAPAVPCHLFRATPHLRRHATPATRTHTREGESHRCLHGAAAAPPLHYLCRASGVLLRCLRSSSAVPCLCKRVCICHRGAFLRSLVLATCVWRWACRRCEERAIDAHADRISSCHPTVSRLLGTRHFAKGRATDPFEESIAH